MQYTQKKTAEISFGQCWKEILQVIVVEKFLLWEKSVGWQRKKFLS